MDRLNSDEDPFVDVPLDDDYTVETVQPTENPTEIPPEQSSSHELILAKELTFEEKELTFEEAEENFKLLQEYCMMRGIRAPCYELHKIKHKSAYYPIQKIDMNSFWERLSQYESKQKLELDIV